MKNLFKNVENYQLVAKITQCFPQIVLCHWRRQCLEMSGNFHWKLLRFGISDKFLGIFDKFKKEVLLATATKKLLNSS